MHFHLRLPFLLLGNSKYVVFGSKQNEKLVMLILGISKL